MKQFYVLAFFVLLVFASAQARDTTELYSIGGFAGYNLNFHSADFQKLPGVPGNSPGFTTGTDGGFTIGGLFEYPLSRLLRFQLRASYGSLSGTMRTQENPGNQLNLNNPDGVSVTDIIIEHRMRGIFEALFIEPAASYSLGKNFSVQVGPSVGFMLTNSFEQEEVILQPSSITFLNNRTIMNDTSGSMPGGASTYLAAFIGASYELSAGKKSALIPSVRYYLPFSDVGSVPWKVSVLQFSAALRTSITPSIPIPVIQDTVYIRDTTTSVIAGATQRSLKLVESTESFRETKENETIVQRTTIHEQYLLEVPRSFALSSALEAIGIGANGQRISSPTVTIEETEIEETFPLLPYIFFKQGDADLRATRADMLSAQQTQQFRIDALPSDALGIYTHNLNIIGQRMKNAPKAILTITGCINDVGDEKNNAALAKARAIAVRDYLVDVWHVRPEQLIVRNQGLPSKPANNEVEEGQAENRRVEISSTDYAILQPVSIREISKAATPPTVLLVPSVQAEGTLASWQLTLRQGNRALREYKGANTATEQKWNVMEYPIPQSEEPVVATLFATDGSGQRTEAMQTIPVRQLTINRKRVEIKDDKRIEIFSLILFDFGKAELNPLNRTIMAEVQKRIEENSTVAIYGYADRTGTPEYNRDLAQRRCSEVADFLRGTVPETNLSIFPVGSDRLLYDNDIPEGRSYSRTVQIVIETPVR